jgi:putative transposase
MIDVLAQDYPVSVTCEVLGCARNSYYHQVAEQTDEAKLKAAIKSVAAEWPTYGYRRITAQLKRQEWHVNHKRVQGLMQLTGLQAKIKRRKRRTTNSAHDFPRYPNLNVIKLTNGFVSHRESFERPGFTAWVSATWTDWFDSA